jgi:predicted ribonuclease YlaK
MPKKNEGIAITPDNYYVVDISAALNFPDLLDPNADLPERHLIIPKLCYQRSIKNFSKKDDAKGESACELSELINAVIKGGRTASYAGFEEYTLGKTLHVIFDTMDHPEERMKLGNISGDGIIDTLAVALHWKSKEKFKGKVKVLSNDTTAELAALDVLDKRDVIFFELNAYSGWVDVSDNTEACLRWSISKKMSLTEFQELCPEYTLYPHEFVFFTEDSAQYRIDMIGRYDGDKTSQNYGYIVPLEYYKTVNYTKPRNRYQACAIEAAAMPPKVCLCSIQIGPAGSGKTRIALGVALEQSGLLDGKRDPAPTQEKGKKNKGDRSKRLAEIQDIEARQAEHALLENYDEQPIGMDTQGKPRMVQPIAPPGIRPLLTDRPPTANYLYDSVIFVPPKQMLYDLPPVPGDRLAKNIELLAPYRTIIPMILSEKNDKKQGGQFCNTSDNIYKTDQIIENIPVFVLGSISGQNFLNSYALHDEIQKETLTEIVTILERVDTGGKCALMGDPTQRTNRYGAAGSPAIRFTRLNAKSPYVAVMIYPHNNDEQTTNCIERPGGKAAMFCRVRTATY